MDNSQQIDLKGLGNRVRLLRGEESQAAFAIRFDTWQNEISRIEQGKTGNPSIELLLKISRAFRVSLEWLLVGEGVGPGDRVEDASYVYVPRLDVQAEAGAGIEVHSEQVVDHLAFRAEWVHHQLRVKPENLVLIEAVGDSMQPTIYAGDLLLVDISKRDVVNDAIYCLRLSIGELAVKRVQVMPDGEIVIRSDNPRYQPFPLTPDRLRSIGIVGRVVWEARKL